MFSNQKPTLTIVGVVTGAVLALLFSIMGSPGLIGVGAVLGMSIGSGLANRKHS